MRFIANVELADTPSAAGSGQLATALRIVPKEFAVRFTKAKVSWFKNKVDMAVQMTLTTLLADETGVIRQADIAKADFPLGKLTLPRGGAETVLKENELRHLISGWHQLPMLKTPLVPADKGTFKVGLLNISATVVESDDLGDVIAKGSKAVSDNRDKLIDAILNGIGLRQPKSDTSKPQTSQSTPKKTDGKKP